MLSENFDCRIAAHSLRCEQHRNIPIDSSLNLTVGGVMRNLVPNPRSSVVLAAFLIAITVLLPAKDMLQHDSSGASMQAQDITQNVKELYFPFNIYSRVVNPDTLRTDADYLR